MIIQWWRPITGGWQGECLLASVQLMAVVLCQGRCPGSISYTHCTGQQE
jgi:hypothetical protein